MLAVVGEKCSFIDQFLMYLRKYLELSVCQLQIHLLAACSQVLQ